MPVTAINNLDYLATRLHARRSRMAAQQRLVELCRARTVSELCRAVFPGTDLTSVPEFQRRLAQDLATETANYLPYLEGKNQDFVYWLLERFQIENAKVLLRGYLNQKPFEFLRSYLVRLPMEMELDAAAMMAAKSLPAFCDLLPEDNISSYLRRVLATEEEPQLLLLEAVLDKGYFQELSARAGRLPEGEQGFIQPLITQEINIFTFMFLLRARFHFEIALDTLLRFCANNQYEFKKWASIIWSAPDIPTATRNCAGMIIDPAPAASSRAMNLSMIEALAWQRYLRLANHAFYGSHIGIGAVAGYFGLRRVEIANLITLSESIRLGVEEQNRRERLFPRTDMEAAHV